jgi:hypothetical protein
MLAPKNRKLSLLLVCVLPVSEQQARSALCVCAECESEHGHECMYM